MIVNLDTGIFISIHSLRVEGDAIIDRETFDAAQFQSTPSVWRETIYAKGIWLNRKISIHSLRVEGDVMMLRSADCTVFQSTPSVWRETRKTTPAD